MAEVAVSADEQNDPRLPAGIETGSDLESLFLSLTAGAQTTSHEGTFFGLAGSNASPADGPPPKGPSNWQGGGGAA